MIENKCNLIKRSFIGWLTLTIAATIALPAAKAQAGGERFSAKVLTAFCNSPRGAPYDDGICAGYITGVADVMAAEPSTQGKMCLPRDVSTSDFSKLVTRYLSRRPELQQAPAAGVVREALLAAFPCGG
jgi:hypothetical protein